MNTALQAPYVTPTDVQGEITISVPIEYSGDTPIDATIKISIYKAASALWSIIDWWWQGEEIATYEQPVHFDPDTQKDVGFTHTVTPAEGMTAETMRDVGVGIFVDGEGVAKQMFEDVYQVSGGGLSQIGDMMSMMMMMMVMMMVMSMSGSMSEE